MVNLSVEADVPICIHTDLLAAKAPQFHLSTIRDNRLTILARFVEWAYTGYYTAQYDNTKLNVGVGEILSTIDDATLHIDMITFADKYGISALVALAQDNLSAVAEDLFENYPRPSKVSVFVNICAIAVSELGASHSACRDLARFTVRNLDVVRAADLLDSFLADHPEFAVAMVKYFEGPTAGYEADSCGLGPGRDLDSEDALSWHPDSFVVGRRASESGQSRSVSDIDDPFRGWPVGAPSGSTGNDRKACEVPW
ncbi:uncharacterized protein BO95DRAFT_432279 [Aspergillus brunneoviolaceus CBS 621.78]|uniref:Uncharacterized protein n=1 Tax=Aspergillus brunneoviolaceus CBS 621.78 TaxID=1450534 RepID=A0ACD1G7Q3_9EURO|nr:hypothetical protein BO95DRAFT_432279 [Aspergillus brunneoviolaceus CBS 621.78]RAH45314.1 hypothetical protein BO95DRAFT_432279 [Aspergillus brunneoviolaceus CBS 621.78]